MSIETETVFRTILIFLILEIVTAIIVMLSPSQGTCELHFYMLFS